MNEKRIRIASPSGALFARLNETPSSIALCALLPIESVANTWGEEVYFSVSANVKLEADAPQVVDPGSVCFWVERCSLPLPFRPTPVSHGNKCRLVTKVNVLGRIDGDEKLLDKIKDGDKIRVESAA